MGPKKAEEAPAAMREGANLVYFGVSFGENENDKVFVPSNMNCRVDIMLDNTRHTLIKKLAASLHSLQMELDSPPALPDPVEGEEPVEQQPEEERRAAITAKIEKIVKIQSELTNLTVDQLELQEGENAANVKEMLAKRGFDEACLKPTAKYTLGRLNAEGNFETLDFVPPVAE